MTDEQKQDTAAIVLETRANLDQLNKKVDAVIDHTATQLGKLENKTEELDTAIRESHDGLSGQVARLHDLVTAIPKNPDRSELYKALAAAQHEIKNADANIENEFLKKKYADLASCLDAVRGPLSSNGIALIQLTEDQSNSVLGIRTILAHESGQTIEDVITMAPPKLDPQGIGSCRTYMRRYAVIAMCGIAGALDDDAEATKAVLKPAEVEKILYRADELFGEKADEAVDYMLSKVFESTGAKVLGDIPAGEGETALNFLENFKKARDTKLAAAKKKEEAAKKAAAAEKEAKK